MAQTEEGALKVAAKAIGVSYIKLLEELAWGNKWCRNCKTFHPINEFGKDPSRQTGYASCCKRSRSMKAVGYPTSIDRQEKALEGLAWCAGCKDWVDINDYYNNQCRKHRNESHRVWYAKNPIATRLRVMERRKFLKNTIPISPKWIEFLFEKFNGICAYCPNPATTLDHFYPLKLGGTHTADNLLPACKSCNSKKHAKHPFLWKFELTDNITDILSPGLINGGGLQYLEGIN